MSAGTAHITALNQLIYNATAYTGLAQNNATSPITAFGFALHTAWPGIGGSQTTSEASYTGYNAASRPTCNRASGAGGLTVSGRTIALASAVAFPASTSSQNLFFWSMGTATSGAGQILHAGGIGPNAPLPFTALTGAATVYAPAHGLSAGQTVAFFAGPTGTLPTGITEGTIYYVIATGITTDQFQVSATSGGSAISFTGSGGGFVQYIQGFAVVNGYTPSLAAGTTIAF